MTGYVEVAMAARIVRAYAIVWAQYPECEKEKGLELLSAPHGLCEQPTFTPGMRLIARSLREFFATDTGRQAAVLLRRHQGQRYPVGQRDTEAGLCVYGVDALGPYELLKPRKRAFRRQGRSTFRYISLEEAVFFADEPKKVYQAVYLLLSVVTTAILQDGGMNRRDNR